MGRRKAVLFVCGVMVAAVAGGARPVTSAAGQAQSAPSSRLARHFPNVPLRTQDNRDVRFYDDLVKGKVVLINFMFTTCTSLCPRSTANLVKVQELLGDHADRDVFLVSISVDPDHDTPAVLKRYAERYHTRPGWTFVTGKREDVDLIRRGLGVRDNDDQSQHTGMLIYGNEAFGRWASTPVMQSPATLAAIVLRVVDPRANGG
ncbi:MAG: SCO family protein [Acidobacteria bacterium]|nr:MAG: SCO family protein [Acidobacteriota bacterium]